ncbi:MAG: energy-coupling factor transport system ATP-binding protein [Chloroflexia bacterium]|jgi:energy-coupling factor transport system ATP-binding protein|nr:energy-coupling factor transport system ATP-binding protein [Chloroflexia bacterium]
MEQREQAQENIPPGTLQPVLEVRELSFEYSGAGVRAIDSVSFSVPAGAILLVAGPSGCGKSTLLRCLNGLIPHSYKGNLWGEALLLGEDIFKLERAELARRVGTVLQDPSHQLVASTVGADVAFGPENLGLPVPEILGRVDRSLALLHIEALRERDTHALSGGEHQKAAIAGVMALDPQVLLLDEPLANLDPQSAWEALQLFRRLADMGRTVVLVEHRVEDALKIAPEQVMLMDAGRMTYYGDVEGMREAADYHAVKLPAEWVMDKVRAEHAATQEDYQPTPAWRPTGEPVVSYRDVRFSYPSDPGIPAREIVKGVSLDVYAGDRIAVLGPNGSGKSTMLRQMIGLLKPQSGVVTVEGMPTTKRTVAQLAHTVGYVFQNPGHMLFAPKVREELAFGPQNLRRSKGQIDADVEMALRITNLVPQADRPPLALSFGQQKRVALASVLSMRPRVLVMDEPTAGQDYANYTRFMDEIMSLPDIEGVIFITHDLDLAIAYANRVWLVRDGTIVKDGPPEEVLSDLELLRQCGLRPTTLLEVNLALFERTGKFLRAEALAIWDLGVRTADLQSTRTA